MNRLLKLIHRLGEGIRDPQAELTRLQATVRYGYLLGVHGGRQLVRHKAQLLAGALAFRTIFSLVPVLALVLVTLRFVFGEEGIRRGMTTVLEYTGLSQIALEMDQDGGGSVVAEPMGPLFDDGRSPGSLLLSMEENSGPSSLSAWIEQFVANATDQVTDLNVTGITLISVGLFVYAAMSLLIQVESAFNVVLGAKRGRRWVQRVPIYWTLLTLGSLLLAGGIVVGQVFSEGLADLPGWLSWAAGPARLLGAVLMSWVVLVLAFRGLPSARVGLRATAIGALVAAVGFEGAKNLLAGLIRFVAEGQVVVYGSLALVPLTLLWVYVVWLIVLFGLEVANAIHTVSKAEIRGEVGDIRREAVMPSQSLSVGVAVLAARAFDSGDALSVEQISERLAARSGDVDAVAEALVDAGVLRWVEPEQDEDRGRELLVLARPADGVLMDTIVRAQRSVGHGLGDAGVSRSCMLLSERVDAVLRGVRLSEISGVKERV